jgi:DNA-binding CsgD family transcriptional regulator
LSEIATKPGRKSNNFSTKTNKMKNNDEISNLEREVLELMAQDKTTNEIAEIVHVSPMAIKMRILKLKQRKGIRTHAALLSKLANTFILIIL